MTSRKSVIAAETRAEIDQLARLTQRQPHRRDFEPAICATGLIGRLISAAEYAGAVRTLQLTARTTAPFSERHEVLMRPTLAAPPALIGALHPPSQSSA